MVPTVFSADATKLLAADSELFPESSHRDPESGIAFEQITTALASGFLPYYRLRPNLKTNFLGSVGQSWIKLSAHTAQTAQQSASSRPAQPVQMNLDIAYSCSRSLNEQPVGLVKWVAYQALNQDLMNLFWSDNDESELNDAYQFVSAHGFRLSRLRASVRSEFQRLQVNFVTAANRALAFSNKPSLRILLNDEELAVAYLVWHHLKGHRYVAGLPESSCTMIHYSRESIIRRGSSSFGQDARILQAPSFPWGSVVRDWVSIRRPRLSPADYQSIVERLRHFHGSEFPALDKQLTAQAPKVALPFVTAEHRTAVRRALSASRHFAREGLVETLGREEIGAFDKLWRGAKFSVSIAAAMGVLVDPLAVVVPGALASILVTGASFVANREPKDLARYVLTTVHTNRRLRIIARRNREIAQWLEGRYSLGRGNW